MGRNAGGLSSRARTPVHDGSTTSKGEIPIRGAETDRAQPSARPTQRKAAAVHRARTPHGTSTTTTSIDMVPN